MSTPAPTVWPSLNLADAHAMITFMTDVLGFVEHARYADDDDPSVVHHVELTWPEGGGVMAGSSGRSDSPFSTGPTGVAALYVVTDDPAVVHGRCVEAGAEIVRPLEDQDYGSQEFGVRDPEGNLWSFGTYRGADR